MKKSTFQIWAYTQIATGFINLDYQRGKHHILVFSLISIITGAIMLALSFAPKFLSILNRKAISLLIIVISIISIGLQLINF